VGRRERGRTNRVCGKKFVGGVSSQESVLMKKFSPPQMKEVSFPTPSFKSGGTRQKAAFFSPSPHFLISPLP